MKKFLLKLSIVGILTIFSQGLNAQVYPSNATSVGACDGAAYLADSSYATWTWMSANSIIQTGGTNINNLCEGTYSVNLTGSLFNADTVYYFTISANNNPCGNFGGSITSQAASSPAFCNGGLGVALSGGTAPYTYHWTSGTLTDVGTTTATGLSAGTWTCTVTDANGCSASRNFTITQPAVVALPTASAQTVLQGATVANLVATGTNLKWYAAATVGTALATSTVIATGTYYLSQTLNSCD